MRLVSENVSWTQISSFFNPHQKFSSVWENGIEAFSVPVALHPLRCEGRLKPPYNEKRQTVDSDGLSSVAPEAGLEPATL